MISLVPQSPWTNYKLDQDLRQETDYMSCLMTALINEAVYDIEQYMRWYGSVEQVALVQYHMSQWVSALFICCTT